MLLAACWCSCFWTVCVQLILAAKNISCLEFVIESTSKFSLKKKKLSQEENTIQYMALFYANIHPPSLSFSGLRRSLVKYAAVTVWDLPKCIVLSWLPVEISWSLMCFCQFCKLRSPQAFLYIFCIILKKWLIFYWKNKCNASSRMVYECSVKIKYLIVIRTQAVCCAHSSRFFYFIFKNQNSPESQKSPFRGAKSSE